MDQEPSQGWTPTDTFAARLLLVRAQTGLTQAEAADRCGLNRATWATWEAGGSPRHMADVVTCITAGLGVNRDWLLWGGPLSPPLERPRPRLIPRPMMPGLRWLGA